MSLFGWYLFYQAPATVSFRKICFVKALLFVFKYAILIIQDNHYSQKLGAIAFLTSYEFIPTLYSLKLVKFKFLLCVLRYTFTHNDYLTTVGVCIFSMLASDIAFFTEVIMENNEQITPLIERVFLFLEDGNWDKAEEYCERILDIDPRNANTYLAKLMIEYRIKQKSDLATCKKDFEQNTNYRRILQYGDSTIILEVQNYLAQIKEQQRVATAQRKETVARNKQQSIKILQMVVIPVVLIAVLIGSLCYIWLPKKTDTPTETKSQTNTFEYKGLTIKLPNSDNYTAKVTNNKIYFSGEINFTINEFLSYVYAPSGKSFYATGWACSNGDSSFLIKDYATVRTLYWLDDTGRTETVDLQFYSYSGTYKARYACKDGRWPMYCSGTKGLSRTISNDGTHTYNFKTGETTIIGQYQSPNTTVEIIVVKQ